jgi:hypothetical protein
MDRQNDLARLLVHIGNDVGYERAEKSLASAHRYARRVPCGFEILGQAGEVGHGGRWVRRAHPLQSRLARLDATQRRLPTLLELRGD